MNIDNITKKDLKYFGYREELYFVSGLMISGWFNKKRLLDVFGLKTGLRWLQVNFELFQVEKDLLAWEKQLKAILKKDGIKFIKRLNNECIKSGERLIEASKNVSRKSAFGKKENPSIFLKDYCKYIEHYAVFMAMAVFEKPIMEIAENLVERKYGEDTDKDNLHKLITTPIRQTAVEHEQEEFLKIATSNLVDRRKLAEKHARKYGWLAIRYFLGEPWTAKDVLER
jgi:hypothetical protein